mmetsp:Transcript_10866/g.18593  ORF Transcript_10866/g.18593 Transcript_10866/m.18593 type:complete len:227 (+) Transcript_10866:184-864(+)|eukprot:CAMPEP_0184692658 /NCGR_PEP_ID=MMETSP0313-20130426/1044_1 /TAXON_ID=2792 /ORGANISM="Porphyridium aerugineum, Strain SAG 1380-2" /LENGTH=226 /DNA_ID=CAMNT_0027150501 /DNA_START=185 /DNA_END=865 /DNA_ORIENTATION=+
MGLFGKKDKQEAAPSKPAGPPPPSLEETAFNMRFTAKQLQRMSQKASKQVEAEKRKCKEAIQKGNEDGARIFAENAIRQEKQALSYLKLASRLEAVSSKLDAQVKMQMVTGQMQDVTGALGAALQAMDVEKISRTMDTFEKQFEDLDLQGKYMDGAIADTTAMSTPQSDVDRLLNMVADENQLDLNSAFNKQNVNQKIAGPSHANANAVEQDPLEARFAALSNPKP